jgi:hypothetical protein
LDLAVIPDRLSVGRNRFNSTLVRLDPINFLSISV